MAGAREPRAIEPEEDSVYHHERVGEKPYVERGTTGSDPGV